VGLVLDPTGEAAVGVAEGAVLAGTITMWIVLASSTPIVEGMGLVGREGWRVRGSK